MKHIERMTKNRLGEILVSEGVITKEQLESAVEEQNKGGGLLGNVLISMNFATEVDISKAMAKRFQLPFIHPSRYTISEDVKKILPPTFLRANRIVPLDIFGKILVIAACVIPSIKVINEIKKQTGCDMFIYIAVESEIRSVLDRIVPKEKDQNSNWENIFDMANEEIVKELNK